MTSGAATMLGPDAVVIALAPAGPARAALRRAADPRRGLGRAHDRGRAGAARRRIRAPAAARRRGRGPRPAVGRPAGRAARLRARPSARRQSRPPRLDRAVPQPGAPAHPRCRDGGAGMTRIVLVGAGSVEFTRNLLGDILSFEALRDAELVLHDIDPDRLRTAERMAAWTAGALGATPTIRGSLDRREALTGADVVINTIQVGGARATQVDFDIPARYGLQYTINDTINVGGVLRGLRTIPVVLGIAVDMAERLPRRPVPQLHQPDGHARARRPRGGGLPDGRAVPLRVLDRRPLAGYLGLPRGGGRRPVGRRQPPRLAAAPRAPRPRPVPGPARVRRRRPGARRRPRPGRPVPAVRLSTPRSRPSTTPSTTRGSSPRATVERFHVPIGEYLTRVANNLDEYADTKRRLDAGEPFEIERSGEYAARDRPRDGDRRAGPDRGQRHEPRRPARRRRSLIANLAADACVEVPCPRGRARASIPTAVGPLPPQCAAYIRPAVDCQELTVRAALDEDRDARLPRRDHRPACPGPPHARRGLAPDRRADRRRGGMAAGVARRHGPGLARLRRRHAEARPPAGAVRRGPRDRCRDHAAGRRVRRHDRHRRAPASAAAPESAAPAGSEAAPSGSGSAYTGPPVTIEYAIWGDPAEINSQKALVEALHGGQPGHHGRRDRGRLGRLLGQAPDRPRRRRRARRVRDGRPALPRLPGPRRAARPQAVHRRARATTSASSPTTRSRTSRPTDGVLFGLPRDLNVDRALLQQGHVRRGRDPVSRTTPGPGTS